MRGFLGERCLLRRGFYGEEEVDIGLENAGAYLGETFGAAMRIIWAVGLLAAGACLSAVCACMQRFVCPSAQMPRSAAALPEAGNGQIWLCLQAGTCSGKALRKGLACRLGPKDGIDACCHSVGQGSLPESE